MKNTTPFKRTSSTKKLPQKVCARVYPALKTKYLPIITSYVVKNNGSAEDGEDIFHDALIIYLRKSESPYFDLRCSPGTFLFSIARNLWKKRLRRKKTHHEVVDKLEFSTIEEPSGIYQQESVQLLVLKKAFSRLPCPCRRLLNLFYFHQKRYDEIIRVLEISSVQVAKNQKLRCMKKLKKLIRSIQQ